MSEFQQLRFGILQRKPRLWKRNDHLVVIGNEQDDNSWFVFDQRQLDHAVRDHRRALTHEPSAITTQVMHELYPQSCQTMDLPRYLGSVPYGSKAQCWRHFVLMPTVGWETAKKLGQLAVDPLDPLKTIAGRKDAPEIITLIARHERLRQMELDRQPRAAVS